MLDDCKGEKLGEVLVSFSTIVLQTVAAAEKGKPSTISKRLSVASTLSPTEQRSLLPLAIAHKGSLSALLRRKEHMRRHCDGFQKTLDERAVVFGQRKARLEEDSKSCPRASVDPEKLQRAKKQVGLHWHGDPQWLDVLLEGDRVSGHGSRPGTSFERSWVAAQAGSTATQGEPASQGLLTDLEARVTAQAARLRRWTKFRDELAREHESEAIESTFATTSKAGEDFGITFTAHKDLLLDPTKAPNPEWLQGDDVSPLAEVNEYQKLVQSLGQELRDVDEPRKQNQDQIQGRPMQRDHGVNAKPKDTFLQNGLSPWVSKPHKNLKDLAGSQQLVQQSRIDENLSTPRLQDHRNDVSSPRSAKSPHQEPPQSSQPVKAEPSSTAHTVSSRATADAISRGNDTLNTEVDEDDLLAAEIVALTMNAGPSPIKGKPSLAERTRQSMAFTSSRNPALSEELAMQPPLPRASKPLKSSKPAIEADVKSTLLERTRQSMSILPSEPRKAVHKPRPSQRFPTNQFQTPVKSSHRADASVSAFQTSFSLLTQLSENGSMLTRLHVGKFFHLIRLLP